VQTASDDNSDGSLYASQPAGLGYDSDSGNMSNPESPPALHADPELDIQQHPILDGVPCDVDGYDLPPGADPPSRDLDEHDANDFSPFSSQAKFEFAEFIFAEEQMSAGKLDKHLKNLAELYLDSSPPFSNH
jgi:hypothetical protein